MNQPTYYTVLSYRVRLDHRLCPFARLLYGEIVTLSHQTGYCWASNAFFAELYQVKEKAVSRWLKELRQAGHIQVEIIKGNQRKIYPIEAPKIAPQTTPSDTPLTGTTPTVWEEVPDVREKGGPPKGAAKAALLLSNKINNKTEHKEYAPSCLVMDKKEEELGRMAHSVDHHSPKESVRSPSWIRPNPPVAAVPPSWTRLPLLKKDEPMGFIKPSAKEVEDYMLTQKELCPSALVARTQALRFVNYYESNGWKVGRNAMQDWRAAANNWLLNSQTYEQTSQRPRPFSHLHSKSQNRGRPDYSIPL